MLTTKQILERPIYNYNTAEKQSYKELVRESFVIPFHEIKNLRDIMDYAAPHRIAIMIAQITGCRLSELCNMKVECLRPVEEGLLIVWKKGKNQKGSRHCVITKKIFIEEIYYYLNHKRCMPPSDSRLFPFNANSLNQHINRYIRPLLGGVWVRRVEEQKGSQTAQSFTYQLKALRHNRMSIDFVKNYRKYKDAMIAAEFTAREFGHSTYKITIKHYCDAIKELGLLDLPDCCLDIERIMFDSSSLFQKKITLNI